MFIGGKCKKNRMISSGKNMQLWTEIVLEAAPQVNSYCLNVGITDDLYLPRCIFVYLPTILQWEYNLL